MGQGHQTGMMHGGYQHARGDAYGFYSIIMFKFTAIRQDAVALGEDGNEIRRGLQERLVFVRT